jgi:hypothetical protein
MPTGGKGVIALNSLSLDQNLSVILTSLIQNIGNNPEITTGLSFPLGGSHRRLNGLYEEDHRLWSGVNQWVGSYSLLITSIQPLLTQHRVN